MRNIPFLDDCFIDFNVSSFFWKMKNVPSWDSFSARWWGPHLLEVLQRKMENALVSSLQWQFQGNTLFNDKFKEILFSVTSSRKWPFRWQFQENSLFNDNFKKITFSMTISRKWSFQWQFQGNDLFNYNFKEMTFSITISRKWSFQWQFQGNNIFNDNFMEIVFSMTVSRKLYFQWQFHKEGLPLAAASCQTNATS